MRWYFTLLLTGAFEHRLFAQAQNVQAPASGLDELRDVMPPVEVLFWTPAKIWLAVLILGLAFCLVGRLIYVHLKQRRPASPPLDPLAIALQALAKLSEPSAQQMTPKDFASAVADVIRRFLEGRYGIAAPRQTTEEFLETAERSHRFQVQVREQFRTFLGHCDQVKFSSPASASDARGELLEAAFKLVKEGLS